MNRGLDFLRNRDRSQPFFLNLSFARPHSPYVPPPYYFDLYRHADGVPPHVGAWAARHDDPLTAADPNAWRGRLTAAQVQRARSGYCGEISFIDTQIGRLLNWLRGNDPQAWDNTWIVFTSDHGDMQGDHHLWRKTYAYEGSSRIPFVVVPPRSARGQRRATATEVVELRDVMPTLLAAAGVPIPNTVDGCSLIPLLQHPARDWRAYIHGEHCTCYSAEQEMQFVTDGRRKFVWLPRTGSEQFFDLEQDPGECDELSAVPARRDDVARWRAYLVAELEARHCGWVRDGALCCPGNEPLVSPYRTRRWTGAPS